MKFSLFTALLLSAYAAVCSMIFVYANLWFGTLVVFATAALLGVATWRAVKTQSPFLLVFSIAGWSWMVLWFGFVAQTDKGTADWTVPKSIYSISKPIRRPALDAGDGEAKMHSLEATGGMSGHKIAPSWHNFIRFAVCISALLFGCLVGTLYEVSRSCCSRCFQNQQSFFG